MEEQNKVIATGSDASDREITALLLVKEGYECQVAEALVETSKILRSQKNIDLVVCGIVKWAGEDFEQMIQAPNIVPVLVYRKSSFIRSKLA